MSEIISIHAVLWDRDPRRYSVNTASDIFQSTRSSGTATRQYQKGRGDDHISIHAVLWDRDLRRIGFASSAYRISIHAVLWDRDLTRKSSWSR